MNLLKQNLKLNFVEKTCFVRKQTKTMKIFSHLKKLENKEKLYSWQLRLKVLLLIQNLYMGVFFPLFVPPFLQLLYFFVFFISVVCWRVNHGIYC